MRPTNRKAETVAVRWHRRGSRRRVLVAFVTPGGWKVVTGEERAIVGGVRVTRGREQLLPLELSDWPAGDLQIGARDDRTSAPLSDLAADCQQFRATHKLVEREISG